MRWIVSLFTSAGQINPIALALFAGTLILAYQHMTLKLEHRELVRQHNVLKAASKEKVKTLNEARNEQTEAMEAINNGSFDNDYLKRLQLDD